MKNWLHKCTLWSGFSTREPQICRAICDLKLILLIMMIILFFRRILLQWIRVLKNTENYNKVVPKIPGMFKFCYITDYYMIYQGCVLYIENSVLNYGWISFFIKTFCHQSTDDPKKKPASTKARSKRVWL